MRVLEVENKSELRVVKRFRGESIDLFVYYGWMEFFCGDKIIFGPTGRGYYKKFMFANDILC